MSDEFTLGGYRALVEALMSRGYVVRGFGDAQPDHQHLILRHDVDMTLESACRLATVEHELDVRATYFPLLRTEMYNAFSDQAAKQLGRLLDLGHEIGLHFDASIYGDQPDALELACGRECDLLEKILGVPIRVVSFHRPAKQLMGRPGCLAGRLHTYDPRFVQDMGYVSDSRGGWYYGHPLEHRAVASRRALQMLTHPVWWDSPGDESPVQKLRKFLADRRQTLEAELEKHCEPFRLRPH